MCSPGQCGLHSCSRVIKPYPGDQPAMERLAQILNGELSSKTNKIQSILLNGEKVNTHTHLSGTKGIS